MFRFRLGSAALIALLFCCMTASGAVITLTTASGWEQSLDGGVNWSPAEMSADLYAPGGESMSALWPAEIGESFTVRYRLTFPLSGTPVSGTLWVSQDDDGIFKVNGTTVLNDTNNSAGEYGPFDITPYLQSGGNTFEASVYSIYCCGRGFAAYAVIQTREQQEEEEEEGIIPEPSAVGLMAGGLAALFWMGRRRMRAG